jgi:FkbM family methyltransferase
VSVAALAAALEGPVRLFDVGARGGVDPRWDRFHPVLEVLGFEPDPDECERLNREAEQLPYRSRFLAFALGSEEREVTFNVCRWPVASSVFEPNPDFLADFPHAIGLMEVVDRSKMRTTPLDAVCAQETIAPDCLKIDVEGAELEVLRGAEEALAAALVLDVEVEFNPLFRDQPLFAEVDVHVRERGWRLLGLRRVGWRRTEGLQPGGAGYGCQLVSADALYYNHAEVSAGMSRGQALKLAVILAAYRQNDFALAVLRSADAQAWAPAIIASPGRMQRLVARAGRRLDSERRRRIADALQPGDATVWQDAHHF